MYSHGLPMHTQPFGPIWANSSLLLLKGLGTLGFRKGHNAGPLALPRSSTPPPLGDGRSFRLNSAERELVGCLPNSGEVSADPALQASRPVQRDAGTVYHTRLVGAQIHDRRGDLLGRGPRGVLRRWFSVPSMLYVYASNQDYVRCCVGVF